MGREVGAKPPRQGQTAIKTHGGPFAARYGPCQQAQAAPFAAQGRGACEEPPHYPRV